MKNIKTYNDLFESEDNLLGQFVFTDDFEIPGFMGKHKVKKGDKITVSKGKLPANVQIILPGGAITQASAKGMSNAPVEKA